MSILDWNAKKVQNLTGAEIWGFILGRVLMAFALGILATRSFPRAAALIELPAMAVGVVLLVISSKGLWRTSD
jgi:hypothetical protein